MKNRWNHDEVNQVIPQGADALATNRALLRALVASLKARSFAVLRSCDSVAAGISGDGVDRWDSDADLVFDTGAHSWFLLQGFGFQLLIDLAVAAPNGNTFNMRVSAGSLFTGGSITSAPTATDSFLVRTTGTTHLEGSNGAYVLHVVTVPNGYSSPTVISIWRDGVSSVLAFIGSFECAESGVSFAMGGWAIGAGAHDASTWDYNSSLIPLAQARIRSTTVSTTGTGYFTSESWLGLDVPNDRTARYDASPIGLVSDTVNLRGRRGWLPDVYFVRTTAPAATGDIIISDNGDRYALLGGFALPWDAGTVLIDDSAPASAAERAMRIPQIQWSGGALTFSQELEPLAETAAVARWTPIVVSFDVPAGFKATVVATIGASSGLWLVAYGDTDTTHFNGFSPLFADKSSVNITGNADGGWHYEFSILPVGGWHRSDGAINHLIAREATP